MKAENTTVVDAPWSGKVKCEKHGIHGEYMRFVRHDHGVLLCQRCYWDMLKASGVLECEKVFGSITEAPNE